MEGRRRRSITAAPIGGPRRGDHRPALHVFAASCRQIGLFPVSGPHDEPPWFATLNQKDADSGIVDESDFQRCGISRLAEWT